MNSSVQAILPDRRHVERPTLQEGIVTLMRKQKISARTILAEMIRLCGRRKNLMPQDYITYQVYRPDLSPEEKRAFLGDAAVARLNGDLCPSALTRLGGFLNDKFAFCSYAARFGLPVVPTHAIYSKDRHTGDIPCFRSADDIAAFLSDRDNLPVIGKPLNGLQALGVIRVEDVDTDAGCATLAPGRQVDLKDLVREITGKHHEGYLFQPPVRQHDALTGIVGPSLATVRFVSIVAQETPEILYALWKIPAPKAVADNYWQAGSMLADVDLATGTVRRAVTGTGLDLAEVKAHPVSGHAIDGIEIPYFAEAAELVRKAHALFPICGCLGWDVGITNEGPILIECNENPAHEMGQLVTRTGVLNPEYKAVFDRVIERNKQIHQRRKDELYVVSV